MWAAAPASPPFPSPAPPFAPVLVHQRTRTAHSGAGLGVPAKLLSHPGPWPRPCPAPAAILTPATGAAGPELRGTMLPTLRLASRQPGPWGGNGPPTPEEAARHSLSSANELRCRQLLEATTARYRHREATAAVLVPLCSVHGDPSLLYTLRSSRLVGKHKGDVSFPGGKCDPQDQDIVDTALRETREELGLSIQEENVWGVMKPLDDGKNSIVVPVIAQVGPLESLDLTPNPQEVDDVFTMSLAHLLHPRNQGYTHFCRQGRYSYTLPIFLHGPYRVWGLTAIFTELALEMLVPGTYRRRVRFVGQPRKGETRT
ncbi:mitochondrial coenzyme A diphosphatase NUDT8 isoform X1 [Antechinus flavipes]|uniref:mitochondrial coenzyme A diphosphatase NUDT8 isoform X1 n=2 Tax=Antechinus flavipes TaxID=38775 RepID=UPI002235E912|nr:mitochondrial coenzyme A diphosphatase NUDT8 isoform X1 [Antechinus flavipes]